MMKILRKYVFFYVPTDTWMLVVIKLTPIIYNTQRWNDPLLGIVTCCLGYTDAKSATTGIIEPAAHLLATTNSICECISNATNT